MEYISGAIIFSVIIITLGLLIGYSIKKDWPLLVVLFSLTFATVSCNLNIGTIKSSDPVQGISVD